MPAAAVLPAPIAYVKVAAVKKLVVELWVRLGGPRPRVVRTACACVLNGAHVRMSRPSSWGTAACASSDALRRREPGRLP